MLAVDQFNRSKLWVILLNEWEKQNSANEWKGKKSWQICTNFYNGLGVDAATN